MRNTAETEASAAGSALGYAERGAKTTSLRGREGTLVELLRRRAHEQADDPAYTFLTDGEREGAWCNWQQLDHEARAIAAAIQQVAAPGDRALLAFSPGLEFVTAFFGCLYAGVIAVPSYPPQGRQPLRRLRPILESCRPRLALTTAARQAKLSTTLGAASGLGTVDCLATDDLEPGPCDWRDPHLSPGDIAFLQYTSGSTGNPRGVEVRHRNLLHNERMIQQAFAQSRDTVVVGWLPLYHDMGLIGNVLQPLYLGARCVLMSPMSFLQKPVRWLRAIDRYRATTSGAPSFAYELCTRRVREEDRQGLDLSSWTVAFNGAEPVRAETLERFASVFEPCGFRRRAFYPCYGLAEATLFVTGGAAASPPTQRSVDASALEHDQANVAGETASSRRLVGCGHSWHQQQVVIVDPSGQPLPPDRVGEIWIAGESVCRGYWGLPEETDRVFGARLADGTGPFLRTGDLGFIGDGELYITGRLKDLIILRGRNHYPQDIELTVEGAHPALRTGCTAAFSVELGSEERLVVASEVERRREGEAEAAAVAIRRAVSETHEVQVHDVVLLRMGAIPKTSSGKIQRSACRAAYLANELSEIARDTIPGEEPAVDPLLGESSTSEATLDRESLMASSPEARHPILVKYLTERLARAVRTRPSRLEPSQPLASAGLDSLGAIELKTEVQQDLEISLPLASLLGGASIVRLAGEVETLLATAPVEAVALEPSGEDVGDHALSHGQQALWLLGRLAANSAAYHIAAAVRVTVEGDPLDIAALRRALQRLADRHPSLRSTFPEQAGEPLQRVHERVKVGFVVEDATGLNEEALRRRLVAEARRSFDLHHGPLLRAAVFSLESGEHAIVLTLHHLVADFWSMAILARELGELYREATAGRRAVLGALPASYIDYVGWQRRRLAAGSGEAQRLWSYWQRQLSELSELDLPTDRPRPATQTFRGSILRFRLDPELSEALDTLARSRDATPYMGLLAAFQLLLFRTTGQEDLGVGSPTAGRGLAELAGVVGYFVNPVVLRADLGGSVGFGDLLSGVRGTVLEAFEHQDYPFPLLVERLMPVREASHSPLFQTMFVLQTALPSGGYELAPFALGQGGAQIDLGGLAIESMSFHRGASQFDLTLFAARAGGAVEAALEYNSDLFDEVTIRRMAEQFSALIAAAVADPDLPARQLPALGVVQRHQLLVEWNAGVVPGDEDATHRARAFDSTLHQLVGSQARSTPEATALVFGRRRISYRELHGRATTLAICLRALGVGPEVPVGICAERTPELVVGLLAVLEAGGAFVPLDPAYPRERLAFILEDAQTGRSPVLLTQRHLATRLPSPLPRTGTRVVWLDEAEAAWSETQHVEHAGRARPEDLAYVIYTSGSTGRPKGVAIEHRSAVALVRWARREFTSGELEAVLASTSICFDLSIFELFVPLAMGGRVILAQNALELPTLEAVAEVTLINTVPSAIAELVGSVPLPPSVRTVNLAGEPLKGDLVRRVYESGQAERVLNLYGPSEDTTYSTYAHVGRQSQREPVIGRPVTGSAAFVIDRSSQPVPVGVPGELLLGGEGLARGYLGRPGMTAQRFVPDGLGPVRGGRLYRTGDLARYLPDGQLDFLGRLDHQVKVRGFRIELGEIEATLSRHPAVRECVVVVRDASAGDPQLVAYTAFREGQSATRGELRQALGEALPGFMVPSLWMFLAALPLTPNGKVNRKALPAPEFADHDRTAPRTPVEELIAGIWSRILKLERVGVEDNFFELGGHSLLATQVVSRLRQTFGVEIPLQDIFQVPTVAALATVVEAARDRQASASASPLTPGPREGDLPLSFAQERLWFIDQLEPGSAAYNIPAALELRGRLDVAALAASLSAVVRRHEVLRTSFLPASGGPSQVISPSCERELPIVDLSAFPASEREAQTFRWTSEEARRPFDLVHGPLVRFCLLRLGDDEHVLLLTMHHIVSDGWSLGILLRELQGLYRQDSESSELTEPVVQYADVALWQRQWLSGETLESMLRYWRQRLAEAPGLLELPADRPRPAVQSYRGATERQRFAAPLAASLEELARRHGVTLFMTLLAAFQALLSRLTGRTDVVVGSPVANRTRIEVEDLIGFFVNTLVLRTDASGDPTFEELLARVRGVTLGAYQHQDVPFEKLVEELAPERSTSHTPLFQVLLVLQNAPLPELSLPGLEMRASAPETGTSKFDLSVFLEPEGEDLRVSLEYNTDLFDRTTVMRLGRQLQVVLGGVAADAERQLSALPMLMATERHQLLTEWNAARCAAAGATSLHELFEAQAASQPAAAALVFGESILSYGELNARANRLASRLRGLGVAPEARVGILMPRGTELVVALFGVLKAGGAYVPLDPVYPQERLELMLADSGARLLVTEASVAADMEPWANGCRRVYLDAAGDSENPERIGSHGSLAYVIYTSGSTGRPKGVAIEHRSALALVDWSREVFSNDELSGVLASTSVCFDLSVFELFVTLGRGGCVVLAENALELPRLASAARVRLINTVPSAMSGLIRSGGVPPGVETVNLAGEPLPADLVEASYRQARVSRVLNLYGPSEDTTYSTWVQVPALCGNVSPSIGRPVAETQVLLLGRHGEAVPLGVPGELHLGGRGLARGYLGRPAMTAERFVPSATGVKDGGRLYRTGDLARYRVDGELDFLGRLDHQVKVRGFRIELGEVETVLNRHPAVLEAVVVVREVIAGEPQLVAYAALGEETSRSRDELRSALGKTLPDYMVPSLWVLVEALPLTPNGKVDRKALPAPEATGRGDAFVAPRTPVEELVAGVWCRVLRLERVGVLDNFFELGGHSLLATQVISRLRRAFGIEIALQSLFQGPTVASLAAVVAEARSRDAGPSAPTLERMARHSELPLSFAQERLWIIDQLEPGSATYNIAAAVELHGRLDVAALSASLGAVVRRHEVLRTSFRSVSGGPVQVISPPRDLCLPEVDLSGFEAPGRALHQARWTREEARRPFDLTGGPLVRFRLLRLNEKEHLLLVTMHHIVSDGWSLGVLLRELQALYEGYVGREAVLDEPVIQYADFALWQRQWLQGASLDSMLSYWRTQLADSPGLLELPTDRPRPAVQSYRGSIECRRLAPSVAAALEELGRGRGATLFMTLLGAFQALMSRLTGQADVVVGTPVAGRTRVEVEDLIGFFVNTLVLRTDLGGDPTFDQLLARVREVTLSAYEHQDLPFEKLVEELAPERSTSHAPLFQVLLVLQNAPLPELSLPGLEMKASAPETGTSKFDLSVFLEPEGEDLRATLEYNTDLFDRTTARRLLKQLELMFGGVVAAPESRISALPLLAPSERHQMLSEWNSAALGATAASGLHQLFEAQATHRPEAMALVFGDASLSYGELNARANDLAWRLRDLDVGPESRVGILLDRSPELVAALLGVLKAGGTYVPLDPGYPRERLAFMLEDSRAEVLVTRTRMSGASLVGAESWTRDIETLDLDEEASVSLHDIANPDRIGSAQNLAYIIYTSGSTGRPKGVAIEHRSAMALVEWSRDAFSSDEMSGVLASTSVCFDLSVFELFVTLGLGGCVVLAQDALELPRLAAASRVRLINTVPSAMSSLVRSGGVPAGAETVCLAGEPLKAELVEASYRQGRVSRVLNLYGPSEDTTYSTWAEVPPGEAPAIGRPVSGSAAYLIDRRMRPAPFGVSGELLLGGEGLARGYLGRPGMTAARFVPDAFGSEQGERLYRTGDLARHRRDGEMDFLGRLDHQVKVRGFRIELGEIEVALHRIPAVRECVVAVREIIESDPQLVAYAVPREGSTMSRSELRSDLGRTLPGHMVPSLWVFLEALPLTSNGKVDRKALPAPDTGGREGTFLAPRTPVEELIAGIWSRVLKREQVGVEESFFELGGHSLLATQVVSQVRQTFGVEIPLQSLFQGPTISALSAAVEAVRGQGSANTPQATKLLIPPLERISRDDDPPLSFAQERLWLVDQLARGTAAYNVPFAFKLRGRLDVPTLTAALTEVVRRHRVLRSRFPAIDGTPQPVVEPPAGLPMPIVDLTGLRLRSVEMATRRLSAIELRRTFDLANGPLLRALLLRLRPQEHLLHLTQHHIVTDRRSVELLVREVAVLYPAFVAGRPSPLPSPLVQYADFAAWQRGWMRGEVLDRQLDYWQRRLGGELPMLRLPTDRARSEVQSFRGGQLTSPLSSSVVERLRQLAVDTGVTLFMTLMAAFQTLLFRITRQEDLIVGTAVDGRAHPETRDLIGFLVNMLPIRADLSGNPTFRELTQRLRRVFLNDFEHRDMPIEKLLESLQPERYGGSVPLFQVSFAQYTVDAWRVELPEIALEPADFDFQFNTTRFDLSLWIAEGADSTATWFYNRDLFDRGTVEGFRRRFETLLSAIVDDPETRLSALELISAADEKRQIAEEEQRIMSEIRGLTSVRRQAARRTPAAHASGVSTRGETEPSET